jgi:hypothetical protein
VALVVWLLALVVPLAQANLSALSDDVLGVVVLALGLGLLGGLLISAALQQYGARSMPLLGKVLHCCWELRHWCWSERWLPVTTTPFCR